MKSRRSAELAIRVRIRVTRSAEILIGPGKADLLEAIGSRGKLALAAKDLGMSYMRAWKLVQMMNRSFRRPLVETERGGSSHGRASLTETGRSVLSLYREMENASQDAIVPAWKRLSRLMAP